MGKIMTRLGSGFPIEISESQLMEDLSGGTEDAADRGKIAPLSKEELDYLFGLFICPDRFVSVTSGNEIILSYDGGPLKMIRAAVDVHRIQSLQIYEKLLGADTLELGHIDYSFKPVKPIVGTEQTVLEQTLMVTHAPLFYGAMPNLGMYSQPAGPCPNPLELMPLGKIAEARDSYESAVENAVKDIVYVSSAMYESGADGINMDTTGAAGDADFLAGLKAAEILKQKYPDICIELGMAGEFILGLHGELEYDGKRLAGLYAHDQVKLAEKAGVTIFGPVVNMKTSRSCPWNLSRVITFMKACCEVARIPIHVNMGMGVGGVPMTSHPPVDITSRASKAMVEICRLDGL
jgi:dimethylamine---corrinoid protein Co-methyltransferase